MTTARLTDVELAALDTDALLDHLTALREAITDAEQTRDALYAARLAAFVEGRSRTPAITQRALAERAGVSEVAVINQIKKGRGG